MIKKLFGFVSGLSGREKVLFYGAATTMFLVLLEKVMLGPILLDMEERDKRIRNMEEKVAYALAVIDRKDKIAVEKEAVRVFLKRPESYEDEILSIKEHIQSLAKKASVSTREITRISGGDESESRPYRVRVVCEAELTKLLEFIYAVEDSEKMFEVEQLTIVLKAESVSAVIGTMVIWRMVVL